MNLAAWIHTRRPTQVYYGWWIASASYAMMFFASGTFFRGFIVFFVPVRDSLGITNFQASLVFSMSRAEGGLEGPAAGWMIDRFGIRKLMMAGVLLAGLGYFAFSRVDNFLEFALVYLGVISLGNSVAFQHAMFAGFNMWFIKRRAFAMSLLAAASALGTIVLIPVITLMILHFSWELTAFIFGFIYLLIILPLSLVIRTSPESMGLLPDGDLPPAGESTGSSGGSTQAGVLTPSPDPRDYRVGEALRTPAFWLLLLAVALWFLAMGGIIVNLQPILIWKGVSQEMVGYLVSLMMGVTVASRVLLGWVADRWPKPLILAGCAATVSLAVVFLLSGSWEGSPWAIILFLILAGAGDSAGIITWATLGDFYGRHRFATLRGIITFSHSWALIASPTFVGWWADHTGCGSSDPVTKEGCSYALPMWIAIIVLGLAALCYSALRSPRRRLPGDGIPERPVAPA